MVLHWVRRTLLFYFSLFQNNFFPFLEATKSFQCKKHFFVQSWEVKSLNWYRAFNFNVATMGQPTLIHLEAVHMNVTLDFCMKLNCIIQHLLPAFKLVRKQRLCSRAYAQTSNPPLCTCSLLYVLYDILFISGLELDCGIPSHCRHRKTND